MKISVRNFNKYQIFDLEGPISVDDADRIEAFIYENISRESVKTVINLKSIIQINSQTLGAFVRIQRTRKKESLWQLSAQTPILPNYSKSPEPHNSSPSIKTKAKFVDSPLF